MQSVRYVGGAVTHLIYRRINFRAEFVSEEIRRRSGCAKIVVTRDLHELIKKCCLIGLDGRHGSCVIGVINEVVELAVNICLVLMIVLEQ
jgi:hypothetical protein